MKIYKDGWLRQTTNTVMTTEERDWWYQWRRWQLGGGIPDCRRGCQRAGRGNRRSCPSPEGNKDEDEDENERIIVCTPHHICMIRFRPPT